MFIDKWIVIFCKELPHILFFFCMNKFLQNITIDENITIFNMDGDGAIY